MNPSNPLGLPERDSDDWKAMVDEFAQKMPYSRIEKRLDREPEGITQDFLLAVRARRIEIDEAATRHLPRIDLDEAVLRINDSHQPPWYTDQQVAKYIDEIGGDVQGTIRTLAAMDTLYDLGYGTPRVIAALNLANEKGLDHYEFACYLKADPEAGLEINP